MAKQFPDRPAVEIPSGIKDRKKHSISYGRMWDKVNALAHQMRPYIADECVVAILLPRSSTDLYLAQLGVLKSGAAYVCIDQSFPDEQIEFIIKDCNAVALITDEAGLSRVKKLKYTIPQAINITTLSKEVPLQILSPPWLTPKSLAYIIYTSGTTGNPKGVMIEHASITNLVKADIEAFGLTHDDRVGQSSSPAYDSSVEETWLAFASGATLVVMDEEAVRMGPDLIPWLEHERISVLCPTPTLLRSMGGQALKPILPDLRLLYVGGEALPHELVEIWSKGRRLVNGYGPTECTVTALQGDIIDGGAVTIGRPIRGATAWVLDSNKNVVPHGQLGELCIGGQCLARGYLNHKEVTEDKFIRRPRFGRIYRTGDWVRRLADGSFVFHGRIDGQVKLRGYRIELEAIENSIMRHGEINHAACYIQETDGRKNLVALVIPKNSKIPPQWNEIKKFLGRTLPSYMIPSRLGIISEIPKTIGGKIDRKKLPEMEFIFHARSGPMEAPRNRLEKKIQEGFKKILNLSDISINRDFFNDLGGDSLSAALLISLFREDPETNYITVRDLYENRSVSKLSQRVKAEDHKRTAANRHPKHSSKKLLIATLVQVLCLGLGLMISGPVVYLLGFHIVPMIAGAMGVHTLLVLSPIILFMSLVPYTMITVILAVVIKKLLIGTYRPIMAPAWGGFYLRNWLVCKIVRTIPWSILTGTEFQNIILRLLGAKIGRRVHIHRGVNLSEGGWDLLKIGNDVTISQDASLQLVDLQNGSMVIGPVVLGDGVTVETRACAGPNTCMEKDASLTAMSFLPAGHRLQKGLRADGIPAQSAGFSSPNVNPPKQRRIFSPVTHGILMIGAYQGIQCALTSIVFFFTVISMDGLGFDPENIIVSLLDLNLNLRQFFVAIIFLSLQLPLLLVLKAYTIRTMGRVRQGLIRRWSMDYIPIWIKTGMVESAGKWLSGSLFWPTWLRCAGMKVGNGCEISTIIDVVPELIDIGNACFLADGIYLGGPYLHRGCVTLSKIKLDNDTFIGNHVVIQGRQQLPKDILIGVCTVADDKIMHAKSAWFGRPAFRLPRKKRTYDRRFTHDPPFIRYFNRLLWETLRFILPLILIVLASGWVSALVYCERFFSKPYFILLVIPMLNLCVPLLNGLMVLILKWVLLGRVRPGEHPLWSCWCSRWDFLYVAWGVCAGNSLSPLQGTLLVTWYLRAMGAKIGRGVLLNNLFTQVVDPDMLTFEDGATVSCMFQAHTFEDRILKIDRVSIHRQATVGENSVVLYGASIGENTYVAPSSVVMKYERLMPYRDYAGIPTR